MDNDFENDYRSLMGRDYREPQDNSDTEEFLRFMRLRNGVVDAQDQAMYAQLDSTVRNVVLFHINNSRKKSASTTQFAAKQLYDDPYHFLHEIIQNADDADYDRFGQTPSMTFHFKQTELVIDLNEDGFTAANVAAICTTGASSKIASDTTTGEKGLGFKSVFSICSKVSIRSGIWSFSFNNNSRDGIGMITPIYEDLEDLPSGVRTRFVLTYQFQPGHSFNSLCGHVKKEPITLLIFLRKLKEIRFIFGDSLSYNETTVFRMCEQAGQGQIVLSEMLNGREKKYYYNWWNQEINNMPEREGRYTRTSKVNVCFPVKDHEKGQPLIDRKGQFVFAYLPVTRVQGLPFIVQADFELPASRQAVVRKPWNQQLIEGVADLFAKCARNFATGVDSTFRYSWLKFFPQQTLPDIWESLPSLIATKIAKMAVFVDSTGVLREAQKLRIVPECFVHDGAILLPNRASSYSFLSLEYDRADHDVLESLGIQTLTLHEMMNAVIADAEASDSTLQQTPLDDSWHDTYASVLESFISGPGQLSKATTALKNASIFPLVSSGRRKWGNATAKAVYYPEVVNEITKGAKVVIHMPPDLGFTVLDPKAVGSSSRRKLYELLGVQQCPAENICKAIIIAHKTSKHKESAYLLAHLEILFWYEHVQRCVLKANTHGSTCRLTHEMFFHSSDEHDAELVVGLKDSEKKRTYLIAAPYEESQMQAYVRNGKTWFQWLESVAKIRKYPPLQDETDDGTLHWTLRTVLTETPEKFLDLLQAHWDKSYAKTCRSNSRIRDAVLDAIVPCIGGSKRKLRDAFFPNEDILRIARSYRVDHAIGILALPGCEDGTILHRWSSLQELSIQSTTNLVFAKRVLTALPKLDPKAIEPVLMANLYEKFGGLARVDDGKELQEFLAKQALFFDPNRIQWRFLKDCVWSSKLPLTRKSVVSTCYKTAQVQNLFKAILKMGDSTIDDYLGELEEVRKRSSSQKVQDVTRITTQIYEVLNAMAASDTARQDVRSMFKKQDLIFCKGQWLKPNACVWHESVKAGGHVPIKLVYPNLSGFFMGLLHVETVSDTFMMRQLVNAASKTKKDAAEIKRLMLDTSLLLTDAQPNGDLANHLDDLFKLDFLPCLTPSGDLKFMGASGNFFIPDDCVAASVFRSQLSFLDLTYSELNQLHRLLTGLDLQGKYLSKNIEMKTERGKCVESEDLTKWLRDCAFAISSCAVFHQSPLYANQASEMHDQLRNAKILVSNDMRTVMAVKHGGTEYKVDAKQMSLILVIERGELSIILPKSRAQQRLCQRSELPTELMALLQLSQTSATKQLYRILNELDMATDQILEQEGISPADWLQKTERVTLPTPPASPMMKHVLAGQSAVPTATLPGDLQVVVAGEISQNVVISASEGVLSQTVSLGSAPVLVPATVNHHVEAPEYHLILKRVVQQASSSTDQLSAVSQLDLPAYPKLFGVDGYDIYRIGAAGELYAYELLKKLTLGKVTLDSWPSGIRHFVSALQDDQLYGSIEPWTQAETSDLVYNDVDGLLPSTLMTSELARQYVGVIPKWLSECQNSLEWHFEVKTTVGECSTPFTMSQNQYTRMRDYANPADGERRHVYCIIRIYDLLKDKIGVRIFIDPWRFRDSSLMFDTSDKWLVTTS